MPACQAYVFWWPPLDVSTGKEGEVGPQVNKFEHVPSDVHLVSGAGGWEGEGCRCDVQG